MTAIHIPPAQYDLPPLPFSQMQARAPLTRTEQIQLVNRIVNKGIRPDYAKPKTDDQWKEWPLSGQCHDYALTKQIELGYRGIPSQLAEVELANGEHHLVLFVDNLVLDNLTDAIISRAAMAYKLVREQSSDPANKMWERP